LVRSGMGAARKEGERTCSEQLLDGEAG
jgi:hypothetical protein